MEEKFKILEEHQRKIPRLPVPDVKDTCAMYVQSLQSLLSSEEFRESKANVEEFLSSGLADKLQAMLKERASDPARHPSWLEEWWDDMYLAGRDPIPVNVNYFFGWEPHPRAECMTQVGRAATMLATAAKICARIQGLAMPMDVERNIPQCMSQYRRVFCASRIPGEAKDYIISYNNVPDTYDEKMSLTHTPKRVQCNHAIIMMRNRMFAIAILDGNGAPIPQEEIMKKIAYIVHHVSSTDAVGFPVGLFTTMERTDWFHAREHLLELGNEKNLELLQRAVIVLCLDGIAIENESEHARLCIHGPGTNRWFDRHNIIITANGSAGVLWEHSLGDGATVLGVADEMYKENAKLCPTKEVVDKVMAEVSVNGDEIAKTVAELHWKTDDRANATLKKAHADFTNLVQETESHVLRFKHFGSDAIKKMGCSPDGFVQVAYQLACHKLYGHLKGTYESTATRHFLHGRTEVTRGATAAALDFCEAATQPIWPKRVGSTLPSVYDLLKRAVEAHVGFMKQAKGGKGVDRHLLGLKKICIESGIPLPKIYTDPAFAKSCHWNLSTSNCGSNALCFFGYGPVVPDGYGLGYMIRANSISVMVTSKWSHPNTSATLFANVMEATLLQMKCICDSQLPREPQVPLHKQFVNPMPKDYVYDPEHGFKYDAPGVNGPKATPDDFLNRAIGA